MNAFSIQAADRRCMQEHILFYLPHNKVQEI